MNHNLRPGERISARAILPGMLAMTWMADLGGVQSCREATVADDREDLKEGLSATSQPDRTDLIWSAGGANQPRYGADVTDLSDLRRRVELHPNGLYPRPD